MEHRHLPRALPAIRLEFRPLRNIIALCGALLISACEDLTPPKETKIQRWHANAERVLKTNGYTNILIDPKLAIGCGYMQSSGVGFSATNQFGNQVTGSVCGGGNDGHSVRIK